MAEEAVGEGVAQTTTPIVTSETGATTDVSVTTTQEPQELTPYTDEELAALAEKGEDFDRRRLTPAQAAIQKTFEKGYTPKFQEAADLRKKAEAIIARAEETPEVHYEDPKKNRAFIDYLENPVRVVADINAEIARLEGVTPIDDEGHPNTQQYRQARSAIAYWNGIKDEFSVKRTVIVDQKRDLGEEGQKMEAYAVALGFTRQEFRSKPELRKRIQALHEVAAAAETGKSKEVVKGAPKLAIQTGGGGGVTGGRDAFDPKLSPEERIGMWREQKKQT